MSVTRINIFEAKEGMEDELHTFLKSIVPIIEGSKECVSCQLLQSQEHKNEFIVIEVWTSVATHQASAKDIPPEQIAQVMRILASPPSGSYYSA